MGKNKTKIAKVMNHWNKTNKSLEECMRVVEPDIKKEVLQRILNKRMGNNVGQA